jgi:predicted enzyme related to lactoylglutathione lyase
MVGLALVLGMAASVIADDEASPVERSTPPSPVVFWELGTHDGPRSLEFFTTVFGWESAPVDGAKTFFHTLDTGGEGSGIDGGVFTLRKARPAFVAVYILVEDIEAKARLVEEAGGMIVEPPNEISPGVWICLFNEPSGVTFAMLERR